MFGTQRKVKLRCKSVYYYPIYQQFYHAHIFSGQGYAVTAYWLISAKHWLNPYVHPLYISSISGVRFTEADIQEI